MNPCQATFQHRPLSGTAGLLTQSRQSSKQPYFLICFSQQPSNETIRMRFKNLFNALSYPVLCQRLDYVWIRKRHYIPVIRAAFCDCLKDSPHDLAASCLWQVISKLYLVRLGNRPYMRSHMAPELFLKLITFLGIIFKDHKRVYCLAFYVMGIGHNSCFSNIPVADKGAFNFRASNPVACNFYDVIYPAHYPEISIMINSRAVPCQINAEFFKISVLVSLRVVPDRAQHSGPRVPYDKVASFVSIGFASVFPKDVSYDPKKWLCCRAGLEVSRAWKRGYHYTSCFCLPPCVYNWAPFLAYDLVVPHPRFGVYRLANCAQKPQAVQFTAIRP